MKFPLCGNENLQTNKFMETVYVKSRSEWRKWLEENFDKRSEIWLILPKKESGKEKLEYNISVEEALCFGWIDSTIKPFESDSNIQRFSKRKPKSGYSQLNRERLKWLLENDMIHPSLLKELNTIAMEEYIFPDDILQELHKDELIWKNYQGFTDSYKRIRIAYIDTSRKLPGEFQKRLNHFLNKTRENKLILAYGGSEKYYLPIFLALFF